MGLGFALWELAIVPLNVVEVSSPLRALNPIVFLCQFCYCCHNLHHGIFWAQEKGEREKTPGDFPPV